MLSKLPIYYIQRFVILLMSASVVAAGVFTFGNAELFDRIFLGVLIALIVYFHDDKNLASVFAVIALGRIFEEVLWLIPSIEYVSKILIYSVSFIAFYMLRYDTLGKAAIFVLICICGAELYWYLTAYSKHPNVSWFVLLILQDVVIRHLLFMRPVVFKKWAPYMSSLPLDLQLYNVYAIFFVVNCAMIFEYFLRHLFLVNSLIIFDLSPYINQFIASVMLWFILNYSIKRTSLFNA